MKIDRQQILKKFKNYVDEFAGVDRGVQLKYAHSLRVAHLSEQIAASLNLSKEDIDLAWLIGILHDIGRFEQLRRYHTFIDYQSMDHAKYGVHYLFDEGHIRDFIASGDEDDVIKAAVGEHNVYKIRDGLTPRQDQFTRLIRDADKVDIFRVYVMYMEKHINIWHIDFSDMNKQSISDRVMAQARARTLVRTQDKLTFIDFFVGVLCLYFDLNFAKSRELTWKEGNYEKLLHYHSKNPDTEEKLEEIRQMVRSR
ncbi:MAG: HD domain-containing protein [Acidaminococcus sp.]|jgi:putative nucleotidyltransferase with HDIG domain|nr:HD domain-containing protein [Acidaminococcus sp.]MCI2114441.1 HD domain-containing protein [Acidaminococcus sp.]MCI2116170.1 HD domain-containing protein [Acidaminococcus sp.]